MQRPMKTNEEKRHVFERGLDHHREALALDAAARTKEDYACVEEAYWMAFNALTESPESRRQEICASILERIAGQLRAGGRPGNAESLLRRARAVREGRGDISG